ncbi:MAG TPA: peptidase M1, partial [Chitinophagaceae bacterium]|nr:peptidase M1 [Chitinophagaceae bacterium]
VNSIKFIDYGLGNIEQSERKAELTVKRIGKMPMPIDIEVTYKDGTKELYYIPLNLMYGNKPIENTTNRMVLPAWRWTHPEYQFKLSRSVGDIKEIVIDPTLRLADVNKTNNKIVVP